MCCNLRFMHNVALLWKIGFDLDKGKFRDPLDPGTSRGPSDLKPDKMRYECFRNTEWKNIYLYHSRPYMWWQRIVEW